MKYIINNMFSYYSKYMSIHLNLFSFFIVIDSIITLTIIEQKMKQHLSDA